MEGENWPKEFASERRKKEGYLISLSPSASSKEHNNFCNPALRKRLSTAMPPTNGTWYINRQIWPHFHAKRGSSNATPLSSSERDVTTTKEVSVLELLHPPFFIPLPSLKILKKGELPFQHRSQSPSNFYFNVKQTFFK